MLEGEKISVLMIEDSGNEARIINRLLQDINSEFTLSRVSRLGDAMNELAYHKKDVVILDLGLPDSHGPEAIRTIHARYPKLPIVVLSGRSDIDTMRSALEYGAQEFVSKNECSGPIVKQALLTAIARQSLQP